MLNREAYVNGESPDSRALRTLSATVQSPSLGIETSVLSDFWQHLTGLTSLNPLECMYSTG